LHISTIENIRRQVIQLQITLKARTSEHKNLDISVTQVARLIKVAILDSQVFVSALCAELIGELTRNKSYALVSIAEVGAHCLYVATVETSRSTSEISESNIEIEELASIHIATASKDRAIEAETLSKSNLLHLQF